MVYWKVLFVERCPLFRVALSEAPLYICTSECTTSSWNEMKSSPATSVRRRRRC